jgi:YVTN family beta-propeller protein
LSPPLGPRTLWLVLRRGGSPQRLLTTVLFTDIVGSTERASRLGDRGWKDLVARHHAIVRRELRRFRGRELDTAGDGFFATFERPAQAIECATTIIDALRSLELDIRAAVHMGEAEVMGGKVGGITVHVASRALAQARPGEILTTSTVREVTAGADVTFEDRGVHEFKGVPGEWRLYAVHWQRRAAAPAGALVEPGGRALGWPVAVIALASIAFATFVIAVAVWFLAGRGAAPTPSPSPLLARVDSAVRIDAATGAIASVVPAGASPTGIAIADGTVWVLSLSDKLLTAIPTDSGNARPIGLPGSPTGIAAGGGSAWVSFGFGGSGEPSGFLLRFGASTQRQEQNIPMGNGIGALAVGDSGVWVVNGLSNTVTRIDPGTRAVSGSIDVAEQPGPVVLGDGSLWVGHVVARTVWRIDPATSSRVAEITLRDPPTALALGFGRLWVTSTAGNSLVVIDTATNGPVRTLTLDQAPRGIAAGSDAVWVAGSLDTLLRVDPASLEVVSAATLPGPVEGVASAGDAVWITVQE